MLDQGWVAVPSEGQVGGVGGQCVDTGRCSNWGVKQTRPLSWCLNGGGGDNITPSWLGSLMDICFSSEIISKHLSPRYLQTLHFTATDKILLAIHMFYLIRLHLQ